MKRYIDKASRVTTLFLLFSASWTATGYGITPEQIFVWVSRQMDIEYVYSMPEVHYVPKHKMQRLFQNFSKISFQRWQADYGESRARKIMGDYLNRVIGFYDPAANAIYVGDYLLPCQQQAVLAHELTHYFQHLIGGPIDLDSYDAEDRRMIREMEAYQMGIKFERLYCDASGRSGGILALLY